jgi:hypothetical protein
LRLPGSGLYLIFRPHLSGYSLSPHDAATFPDPDSTGVAWGCQWLLAGAIFTKVVSTTEAAQGVYVYWSCNGRDDLSRVLDLSIGGLFLEAPKPRVAAGSTTKLHFLVSEGSIRADAVIQHVLPGKGLGLKLTALPEEDRARFTSLVKRLRG